MKNKDLNIWQFLLEKLTNNLPSYLMVIVESQGSSPGRKGFKMAVSADGGLMGSIGGGTMEHRLVEQCKKMLHQGDDKIFLKKENHHADSNSPSGMICSGNQTIAFFPIGTNQRELVQHVVSAMAANKPIQLYYSPKGMILEESGIHKKMPKPQNLEGDDWLFSEVPGKQHQVYIVGGGHVSLALSQQLALLDFHITVFDNREGVNTFVDNHFAHEKTIIDYKDVSEYIPEGSHIMVVIMTQFHTSDALVLSQLIHKNLGYLGMMGSKSKVAAIFGMMESKGVTKGILQKVHAPIGLDIKSQSPEEIAVSIAGELIEVKNG